MIFYKYLLCFFHVLFFYINMHCFIDYHSHQYVMKFDKFIFQIHQSILKEIIQESILKYQINVNVEQYF